MSVMINETLSAVDLSSLVESICELEASLKNELTLRHCVSDEVDYYRLEGTMTSNCSNIKWSTSFRSL